MKKRFLCIVICITLCVSVLPLTAWAATQISSVAITNLPTPFAESQVSVSATVNTTGAQLYSLDWYDKTAGRFLESTDRFTENHVYEVQLWVEAQSGYEFRTNGAVPNVTATVGGKTAKVSKAYEYQAWAMIVVSYTFEPCGKKEIQSVDIQLEGITKSGNGLRAEQGQYVPFSIQSGDEKVALYPQLHTRYYPYGFHWTNFTKDTVAFKGDRFQGGCDYYVTIALKPRDSSFTFADNFTATIGGKSAQIKSLGKTYAEITVEVTCIGTIAGGNINPVVSLPRDGNAPDYGLYYGSCEHIDYATVTGWYDVESGARLLTSEDTFHAGKQYRVEVECTAAYAYKFQRDANDKMEYSPMITGEKVDSYSFGYDSYRGREVITLVKTYTVAVPDHTHTDGNWQCDDSAHTKYCTACGKVMGGGAHYGGTATCIQKAKCTVCGYGYGELEDHKWSPKYHPVDATGHALQCANCKGYDTRKPHTPGPAATETTPQTCTECGYIITPAKNHTHNLTKVAKKDATCIDPGNTEYYSCDGCSDFFADSDGKTKITDTVIAPLGHKVSENWSFDKTNHWRTCTVCNAVLTETQMAHAFTGEKCTTCSYDNTTPVTDPGKEPGTEPTDTTPAPTDPQSPDQGNDGIPWWILLLIGLVAVAVGVGGGMLILNKKKKEKES